MGQLSQLFDTDAGQPENLRGGPGPEGASFLGLQVTALAGGGVLGPQVATGLAWAIESPQYLAGGGELFAGVGGYCRGEQRRGPGASGLGGGDQGGQYRESLPGALIHPRLTGGGGLAAGAGQFAVPDGAGCDPGRPP